MSRSLNTARSPNKAQSPSKVQKFSIANESSNMAKLLSGHETEIFSNPSQKDPLTGIKSSLELKINGEQNRVLLSNIRPSFYREKNDAPTLAHYDDSVKMSSSFFKSTLTNRKSFSKTSTMLNTHHGGKKEEPVVTKFKEAVGLEAFGKIRDLFEHYSAYSGKLHYMDSHEYHRFMKENDLYSEQTPKIKLDLLFSKNNKAKEKILYEIAKLRRPEFPASIAVEDLLKATILTRQNVNYQEKASKFEDWFIELENPTVVDYLNSQKAFFLNRFKKYEVNHQEFGLCITLPNFLKFCQKSGIIPNMLSQAECARMFKASQRKNSKTLHTPYLLFSEFVESVAFVAFLYYTKEENKSEACGSYLIQIQNLVKWLSKRLY